MTEYDYSPEAYERYLATQQRISRWVDHTQQQPPANPFVPSVPTETESPRGQYSSHSGSSSRHHRSSSHSNSHSSSKDRDYAAGARSRHSHRPTITRTHTSPHSHSTHDSHSHTAHRSRHSLSRRRSSSLSPSSSTSSRTLPYSIIHPDSMNPTVIEPSSSQPIVVPINGGQGGYVIVPPRGRRLNVIDLNQKCDPEERSRSIFKKLYSKLSS